MSKAGPILITDDSKIVVRSLQKAIEKAGYETITAMDGEECLRMIEEHAPPLVFLDIMLPKIHGIQVLKMIKESDATKDTGVVMSTGRVLQQDYQSAIECGADYYMTKPFKSEQVQSLVERFFAGTLSPAPLSASGIVEAPQIQTHYEPAQRNLTQYARFWGTRGSIPVSGLEYYRYGGNTSCLEVVSDEHMVIIDAGTGIRELGQQVLDRGIKTVHLVIGHTHWDHIMGFPFFAPVYSPQCDIKIYAAKGFHKPLEELFSGMLEHDYFPVRLDEMQANFEFIELCGSKPLEFGQLKIHYHYANHPGSTLCFKVETKNRSVGYATDNELFLGYHGHPSELTADNPLTYPYRGMIDFYTGCDVLIHEAQYTPQEYRSKVGWGHSSVSNTAALVNLTGVPEWIATHHDPVHTDPILLEKLNMHRSVLQDCGINARPFMAYDGQILTL